MNRSGHNFFVRPRIPVGVSLLAMAVCQSMMMLSIDRSIATAFTTTSQPRILRQVPGFESSNLFGPLQRGAYGIQT